MQSGAGTVKGAGFANSEIYQSVMDEKSISYYKPLDMKEGLPPLPEPWQSKIKTVDTTKLPFHVGQERAYLVTFQHGQLKTLHHQIQLTYLKDKDEYGRYGNEFFIIRMTEVAQDPFANLKRVKDIDLFGNKLEQGYILEGVPYYHHIIQTNSAYTYQYYGYDDEKQRVNMTVTNANEINFYMDGIHYQIAYQVDGNRVNRKVEEQMVALAKAFVHGQNNFS